MCVPPPPPLPGAARHGDMDIHISAPPVQSLQTEPLLLGSQRGDRGGRASYQFKKNLRRIVSELYIRDNCHPFKASLLVWVQLPMWVSLSLALRNLSMASSPAGSDVDLWIRRDVLGRAQNRGDAESTPSKQRVKLSSFLSAEEARDGRPVHFLSSGRTGNSRRKRTEDPDRCEAIAVSWGVMFAGKARGTRGTPGDVGDPGRAPHRQRRRLPSIPF
ncbi:unnamed protein product [Arctogadus glacialis]